MTFGYGQFGELHHFHVRHDYGDLCVLVDFVSDTTPDRDHNCWVHLDIENDKLKAPQQDDYRFAIRWLGNGHSFGTRRETGNGRTSGSPIEGFSAYGSTDPSNDPYLTSAHWIYDFKIPKTILTLSPVVGFRVVARNAKF